MSLHFLVICAYLVFPSEPDNEDRETIDIPSSSPSSTSDSDEEHNEPAAKYAASKPLPGDNNEPVKIGWFFI